MVLKGGVFQQKTAFTALFLVLKPHQSHIKSTNFGTNSALTHIITINFQ